MRNAISKFVLHREERIFMGHVSDRIGDPRFPYEMRRVVVVAFSVAVSK